MSTFKIATWNVNSLRVRLPHLLLWLKENEPDVVALQETKIQDNDFPAEAIAAAGYTSIFSGQKSYNGVAFLSKRQMVNHITEIPEFIDPQKRVLGMTIDDIRVINLYVPNGQTVFSEKYQYKLNWLEKLASFLQKELETHAKLVVLGDFNIAPTELDLYDPEKWQGKVLFTEPERDAFQKLLQLGLKDCFRHHAPSDKSYSWWDYRLPLSRNLGARIDHVLASHSLITKQISCHIDKAPREWERPSDHAPVIACFHE